MEHRVVGWPLFCKKNWIHHRTCHLLTVWILIDYLPWQVYFLINKMGTIISLHSYRGDEINLDNIRKEISRVPDT